MKLNRIDGIGPSRRPELDQEDQPPAQRQRHEAPSTTEPNALNLPPAPRRASSGQGRDSTASHVRGRASDTVELRPGAPARTNAGAPLQGFLSSRFGELPRRGPDESVQMYRQRLATDHSDLTSRYLSELARNRLSRATLSDADRRQMARLLANVNVRPQGANESSAAYEEQKRVLYVKVAARILRTTPRALLDDLVSMAEGRSEDGASTQNAAPTASDMQANTPGTVIPAPRADVPTSRPSTQPLAPSQGEASGHAHARWPDRPSQPAVSAGPSGTARLQPGAPARTNAGAPLQGFLSSRFGELPRRGPDESVQMYRQRLATDHSDLTSRYLSELARNRLSRATLSDADRRQMARLLANVNVRPQGANESSAAYEEQKRVLYVEVAARILGTTPRALLDDLVSMAEGRSEDGASTQNAAPTASDMQANAPGTAMSASRPHAPAPEPSTQPLASSQGAPSGHAHARWPDRPSQPAVSAGPSGTARLQPGAPSRTNATAPLPASLIDAFRHLPPQRPGESNHTYAYRLYGAHGQQFVPLLHRFASERLPDNEARVRMTLATALMETRRDRYESEAAHEQRRHMLGIGVAAELLNTTTNALMLELASRVAESHPNTASSPVTQQPDLPLAIDRKITRDAVDMLTGMNEEVDLIPQTNPHTLAVIDHLGDIGSLPEQDLHPRVLEAVRTASNATQLVMNLRDMVASHPDVLPTRQQAQQRIRR